MLTVHVFPEDDLQAVFDGVPENATILLAPGTYRQKAVLRKHGVTLQGAGAGKTALVHDDYARKKDGQGRDYVTFRTYTLAVCADGVTVRDLSIVNDAGSPHKKGQEVALSVVGTDFYMESCTLLSTQDTLFAGPLPPDLMERYDGFLNDELRRDGEMIQRYVNCVIGGTVDFIFGCADAAFEGCEIRSVKEQRSTGYVAAPAHSLSRKRGFRFRNCDFTCEAGVIPGSVFLARPWRDYGMASFENCRYGDHIAPVGFDKWNDTDRDKTARFFESPAVPGRVAWVNREGGSTCE